MVHATASNISLMRNVVLFPFDFFCEIFRSCYLPTQTRKVGEHIPDHSGDIDTIISQRITL